MLLIVGRSMRYGAQRTHASILGNVTALLFSCCVMAAGLSALFATSELVVNVLRMFGAAYLIYIGVKTWCSRGTIFSDVGLESKDMSARKLFLEAFLVSVGNPKTILFLTSCFTLVVEPNQPLAPQLFVFAATFMVFSYCSLTFYALCAERCARLLKTSTVREWFRWVFGALFVGSGAALAVTRD